MKRILTIIVLYRLPAEQSHAFRSLSQLLHDSEIATEAIEVMICDNSPDVQAPPVGFSGVYLHDSENPGLAKHYNKALETAVTKGIRWLMLLDQDTTLTSGYIAEVLDLSERLIEDKNIVALVPKLIEGGKVQSPHRPPKLRYPTPLNAALYGATSEKLHVYNSAAVLRVEALSAIGGFPEDFPLDYLDHATFHNLQSRGGRLFLLRAMLEHELSSNQSEMFRHTSLLPRQQSVLVAERTYYRLYGTPLQRTYHRLRLLRMAYKCMKAGELRKAFYCLHLAL
jgi:GT2 family glycosyltransferase